MIAALASGFHRGAIARLGILGFEGIWRGRVPHEIFASMRRIERTTLRAAAYWNAAARKATASDRPAIVARNIVVSDSIFVAAWAESSDPVEDEILACLFAVKHACRSIIRTGLTDDALPLAYRGAITLGEFSVDLDHTFVIGPAVDEVAGLQHEAEGPFVWLTPSASRGFEPLSDSSPGVVRYGVPLKGGRTVETRVMNPLWADPPLDERILRNLFRPRSTRASRVADANRQHLAAFCREVAPELSQRLTSVIEAGLE